MANGLSLKLLAVDIASQTGAAQLQRPGDATYDPNLHAIVVRSAEDSFLAVSRLQTEGRKEASAHDWWNGVRPELLKNRVLRLGNQE